MNKKKRIGGIVILIITVIVLTFQLTYSFVSNQYQSKIDELNHNDSNLGRIVEVDNIVKSDYCGELNDDNIAFESAKGYISALGDKYSQFLSADEYALYKAEKSGVGQGVGIRVATSSDNTRAVIYSVFDSSPAYEAGVKKYDEILRVNGKKIENVGANEIVRMIHGAVGDEVTIVVSRVVGDNIRELEFTMQRKEIETASLDYRKINDEIGIIQLYLFDANTKKQFDEALTNLQNQNISALILDLRNNSSGELEFAAEILDSMIPAGEMYYSLDKKGNKEVFTSNVTEIGIPVVVITNSRTACGAELLAVGLRDNQKAMIVGENTAGKGISQKIYEFSDGSALILSTSRFYPSKSDGFDSVGIKPDIPVQNPEGVNIYIASVEEDIQLQTAIEQIS